MALALVLLFGHGGRSAGTVALVSYLSIEQQNCNNASIVSIYRTTTATTTGLSNAAMVDGWWSMMVVSGVKNKSVCSRHFAICEDLAPVRMLKC